MSGSTLAPLAGLDAPPAPPVAAVPPLVPATEPEPPAVPPVLPPGEEPLFAVVCLAPPEPVAHCWVAPFLSQAGGMGAVVASRLVPSALKVGLLQPLTLMFLATTPGILRIWSKPALTRLMGSGE